MELKKAMLINIAIKMLALVVSFISTPVLLDFFNEQSVAGVWFSILSILNWMSFCDFGIGNGMRNDLTYAVSTNDAEKARSVISSSYFLILAISLVLAFLGFLAIPFVNWTAVFSISSDVVSSDTLCNCMMAVYLGAIAQVFFKLSNSVMYAFQMNSMPAFLLLLSNLLMLFSLFLPLDLTIEGKLIYVSFMQSLLGLIPFIGATIYLFCMKLKRYRPSFGFLDKSYYGRVFSLGIKFFIIQIALLYISSTNELFIGQFFGSSSVVNYSVAFRVFNLVLIFFSVLAQPIWSSMAASFAESDWDRLIEIYRGYIKIAFVSILITVIISITINPILNLWLQDKAVRLSILNIVSMFLLVLVTVAMNSLTCLGNATNRIRPQVVLMAAGALLKLPVCYFLCWFITDWSAVVLSNAVALVPIVIGQFISNQRLLRSAGFSS